MCVYMYTSEPAVWHQRYVWTRMFVAALRENSRQTGHAEGANVRHAAPAQVVHVVGQLKPLWLVVQVAY